MSGYVARFGGIQRLYGKRGQQRLQRARVCVVGIGGVGSWAVEALARSGIGELTLVDLDEICISNTNRQLPAIRGHYGRSKVEAMAERVEQINPDCVVHPIRSFFTATTAEALLTPEFDWVIDAMDRPAHKCLLIAHCRRRGLRAVTSGGAGGRCDPARIRVADLAGASHDALLQQVRRSLRRDHAFPRGTEPFGVTAVFSTEPQMFPTPEGEVCAQRARDHDLRLDCTSGYGTASFVTGAFGFIVAAEVVGGIAKGAASG